MSNGIPDYILVIHYFNVPNYPMNLVLHIDFEFRVQNFCKKMPSYFDALTFLLTQRLWCVNMDQDFHNFFHLFAGERPYKCSEPSCGRSFVQLSNLQQHMSNHSKEDVGKIKEPNFHCTICGKGFATQSSLVLHHEKKHQEMLLEPGVQKQPKHKPYVCGTCNKSYTTESALVIHSSKVSKFYYSWIDHTLQKRYILTN